MQLTRLRPAFLKRAGFTIIEILIVVGILSILAAITITAISPRQQIVASEDARRLAHASELENAITEFIVNEDRYPGDKVWPVGIANAIEVCRSGVTDTSCINLERDLVPEYIVAIPLDPVEDDENWSGFAGYLPSGGGGPQAGNLLASWLIIGKYPKIIPTKLGFPVSTTGGGGGGETNCMDGIDNDSDSFIDCLDSDCNGQAASCSTCEYATETLCSDLCDNDGDGDVDGDDSDCSGAPTVVTYNPVDGETSFAVSDQPYLRFSEDIQVGVGNVYIKKQSDDSTVETYAAATDITITNDDEAWFPIPDPVLEYGTQYYIQADAGVVKDLEDNNYAGISDTTTWNFTTESSGAPTISSLDPADDATEVATNDNFQATFSENIVRGTGNIYLKKTSDDTTVETIDVTDTGVVNISSNQMTIDPALTMDENTGYYITMDAGVVEDGDTNDFAGISDKTTWNFTTVDTANPTVSTLSPADDVTGVAVGANLVITFNEAVDPETGNITIKLVSDDSTFATIDVTSGQVTGGGTATITINPSTDFAINTEYYVQIDATAFDDAASNSYAGISDTTSWTFTTTSDTDPPNVSTYNPADQATNVGLASNLVITFDENVDPETGNVTIKKQTDDSTHEAIDVTSGQVTGGGTATITVNPSTDFATSTTYYVQIDGTAFDDTAGNSYIGISDTTTWTFTTESSDTTDPTAGSFSPMDEQNNVTTTANLVITFSELVDPETGNITIKLASDDSNHEVIDVTSGQVTGGGTATITINPSTDFSNSTDYYVQIDATAFDDAAGNSYAGISDTTTWNFTTESGGGSSGGSGGGGPSVSAFYPADDATGAYIGADLRITFDENMSKMATGNFFIKKGSDDSTVETIAVTDTKISIVGAVVTINPTSDFATSTAYYVQVSSGTVQGTVPWTGISPGADKTTWNFTTGTTGISYTGDNPANYTVGVNHNPTNTATYTSAISGSPAYANFPIHDEYSGRIACSYSGDDTATIMCSPSSNGWAGSRMDVVATDALNGVPYRWHYTLDTDACGTEGFNNTHTLQGVSYGDVQWGDMDTDGDLDIVVLGRSGATSTAVLKVLEYDGTNFIDANATGFEAGVAEEGGIDLGDYDMDGDLDIAMLGNNQGGTAKTHVYRNNGSMGFTKFTLATELAYGELAWGDADNDGDLDLAIVGQNASSDEASELFRNDGSDTFTRVSGLFTGMRNSDVEWIDYDNDRDLDLIVMGQDSGDKRLTVIYRNDEMSFSTGVTLTGLSDGSVTVEDYDRDSDMDILITGNDGTNNKSMLYSNSGGVFTEVTDNFTDLASGDHSWGDFDGDDEFDLILTGTDGTRKTEIYENDGDGTFTKKTTFTITGVSHGGVHWGDYDADDDLDFVISGTDGSSKVLKVYDNSCGD